METSKSYLNVISASAASVTFLPRTPGVFIGIELRPLNSTPTANEYRANIRRRGCEIGRNYISHL